MARITMQYIGGSSCGRRERQDSSVEADQRVSSWGRSRVTSAGAIREPASNVNVKSDRRTKMAMQILLSVLRMWNVPFLGFVCDPVYPCVFRMITRSMTRQSNLFSNYILIQLDVRWMGGTVAKDPLRPSAHSRSLLSPSQAAYQQWMKRIWPTHKGYSPGVKHSSAIYSQHVNAPCIPWRRRCAEIAPIMRALYPSPCNTLLQYSISKVIRELH